MNLRPLVLLSIVGVFGLVVGGCAAESDPVPAPALREVATAPAVPDDQLSEQRIRIYGGESGCVEFYGLVMCCTGDPNSRDGQHCYGP